MKDRMLWRFAVAGLTLGLVLMLGSLLASELAPLARGYGLLVSLAALYLAAGLAIRARVSRRSPAAARLQRTGASSHSTSRPA
jgi:hypothetical protein